MSLSDYSSSNYEYTSDFHKDITTLNFHTQFWIDKALFQLYGFNHLEAINCFKKGIEFDSLCAIAYWGIAYAMGPHYNYMSYNSNVYDEIKYFISKAVENSNSCKFSWEKDLIDILEVRYPNDMPTDQNINLIMYEYSVQMKKLYLKYQNDPDIVSLYIESVMNINPWNIWSTNNDSRIDIHHISEVLNDSIANFLPHPMIYHLYIHFFELSPFSRNDSTIKVADKLYEYAKGQGHLIHMPSHIYIQVGDYRKSLKCNEDAIEADVFSMKRIGKLNFFTFYRIHNIHFACWTAMFMGNYKKSIHFSNLIKDNLTEEVIISNPNYFEYFYSVYLHVYIRFGKWEMIINDPIEKRENFIITEITQRYARAIAFAVLGDIKNAEIEYDIFVSIKDNHPERRIGNNPCQNVFEIALNIGRGEI